MSFECGTIGNGNGEFRESTGLMLSNYCGQLGNNVGRGLFPSCPNLIPEGFNRITADLEFRTVKPKFSWILVGAVGGVPNFENNEATITMSDVVFTLEYENDEVIEFTTGELDLEWNFILDKAGLTNSQMDSGYGVSSKNIFRDNNVFFTNAEYQVDLLKTIVILKAVFCKTKVTSPGCNAIYNIDFYMYNIANLTSFNQEYDTTKFRYMNNAIAKCCTANIPNGEIIDPIDTIPTGQSVTYLDYYNTAMFYKVKITNVLLLSE